MKNWEQQKSKVMDISQVISTKTADNKLNYRSNAKKERKNLEQKEDALSPEVGLLGDTY